MICTLPKQFGYLVQVLEGQDISQFLTTLLTHSHFNMVLLPIKIKSIMEICLDNYQCYLNEYLKNEIISSNVNNYLWDEIEALQVL